MFKMDTKIALQNKISNRFHLTHHIGETTKKINYNKLDKFNQKDDNDEEIKEDEKLQKVISLNIIYIYI